jgi:bifunctional lysine-specific demethylase and histidyl-hydroxylase NO66
MNLGELIHPIDPADFCAEYWGKQPLVIRAESSRFRQIFSSRDLGPLLEFRPPRSPEGMLLVKGSQHCTINWVHPDGTPRIDKVRAAFQDGYTIVVNRLERHSEAVALLAAGLEQDLHHPIGVNLYLTPPGSQGFEPHYDVMDVFIVQLEGSKIWEVREACLDLPLPDEHAPVPEARLPPLLFETEIGDGTVLYLPRGFVHSARTATAASMHLTIGVNVVTWIDLFSAALSAVRRDPRFKRALPPEFFSGPEGMREQFAAMLEELSQHLLFDDALARLAERLVVPRRAPLEPLLPEDLAVDPGTILTRRTGVICRATDESGQARLHYSGGRIAGPVKIAPALRHVAARRSFTVSSLPGDLSDREKLVLARRLIKEGVVRVGSVD